MVIAAGGAVQTPALLMRSGLRSASGQLGRNLSVHPNAVVTAFFDQDVTGWQGVHQAFQVRNFLDRGAAADRDQPHSPDAGRDLAGLRLRAG